MKKSVPITALALVVLLTAFTTGCKKNTITSFSADEEQQAALSAGETESENQAAFDDVFNNVLGVNAELGTGGTGVFSRTASTSAKIDSLASCATLSITPAQPGVFPKTVVLNFGSGCYSHGHLRSGTITTVYTGRLLEPGASATTTFTNFSFDSVAVAGTHKITNTTTAGGPRQLKVEVTGARLTKSAAVFSEWTSVRTLTQSAGQSTPTPLDDVLSITGASNGTVSRANRQVSWTAETTEPLVKQFTCPWFSKGAVKTLRNGLSTGSQWVGTLNFGDGSCDNKASLTINGNVYQITLH